MNKFDAYDHYAACWVTLNWLSYIARCPLIDSVPYTDVPIIDLVTPSLLALCISVNIDVCFLEGFWESRPINCNTVEEINSMTILSLILKMVINSMIHILVILLPFAFCDTKQYFADLPERGELLFGI